jgi:hypothetical protein
MTSFLPGQHLPTWERAKTSILQVATQSPPRDATPALHGELWMYNNIVPTCAAHIGMGGVKIEKEPRQVDEYVYRIS